MSRGLLAALLLTGPAAFLTATAGPAHATCEFPRRIAIDDVRAYEGTGAGTTAFAFTVSTSGCDNAATVTVATADSSATVADGDYTPVAPNVLTWASGDMTSRHVVVAVGRDSTDEVNQVFNVVLSNPTGFVAVDKTSGLGTILDDDGPLKWNVNDATCTEGDPPPASHTCMVTITLSRPAPVDLGAHLATVPGVGTATVGQDYQPLDTPVVISAGGKVVQAPVTIIADTACEGPAGETFVLQLDSPTPGTIVADKYGRFVIAEDDIFCDV
jgi:hypothetical protein